MKPCSLVHYLGIDVQTNILLLPLPPPQHGDRMRSPSRIMQILYSFKMPAPIYQTTRCHIPNDRIFKPIQHSVYLVTSENLEAQNMEELKTLYWKYKFFPVLESIHPHFALLLHARVFWCLTLNFITTASTSEVCSTSLSVLLSFKRCKIRSFIYIHIYNTTGSIKTVFKR